MRILLCLTFVFIAAIAVSAQPSVPGNCPSGLVCISPQAARQALLDSDTVKAQEIELKAKDQALADFQKELNSMRIELAKAIGEKTGSEQMVVRLTAIIDFMLKNGRTKKYGVINF